MRPLSVALLAPMAASLAGWMLSGSPVPMALTLAVLVAGFATSPLTARRKDFLTSQTLPILLAGAALWLELWLFREGLALALRAEVPFAYHFGVALLWWVAIDRILTFEQTPRFHPSLVALGALAGGILVFGASAWTVLYDFDPWQVYPVSALPLALWAGYEFCPRLRLPGGLAATTLASSLLFASLIPLASATTRLLEPFLAREKSEPLEDGRLPPPEIDSGSPLADGASRKIPREADVRFRKEILVRIKAHSPALYHIWTASPLYLRTSTLALFDSEETLSPVRSGRWLYDLDDGEEDHTIPLGNPGVARSALRTGLHTIYVGREASGHLPLLTHTSELFAPALYEFADDWYQLSPPDSITLLRYTAAASPGSLPIAQPADLVDASIPLAADKAEATSVYLQLPPSPLSARVRELCAGFPSDNRLGAIRQHLGEHARYSLHFKCPDDSSPLDDFLFGSGHGHCEHYAAATVLMLRSLGIPSRVSYGYAGGLADSGQRTVAFRDSDFHAWAEILSADGTWKIFDTTPRVPSAAARTPGESSLPGLEEGLYHDLSKFDGDSVTRGTDLSGILASLIAFFSRFFFPATAVGILLLAALWKLAGRGRGNTANTSTYRNREPEALSELSPWLVEIERIARLAGVERSPGQTWCEFTEGLSRTFPLPTAAYEAVSYHYHLSYAGGSRDPGKEKRMLEALRAHSGEDPRV
ncbi:MAG: hypothetical protein KDN18_00445 [Verrucomicrobiae bacterium]|nr:hypothetical protein [Verrucomicrobiae bacterium]